MSHPTPPQSRTSPGAALPGTSVPQRQGSDVDFAATFLLLSCDPRNGKSLVRWEQLDHFVASAMASHALTKGRFSTLSEKVGPDTLLRHEKFFSDGSATDCALLRLAPKERRSLRGLIDALAPHARSLAWAELADRGLVVGGERVLFGRFSRDAYRSTQSPVEHTLRATVARAAERPYEANLETLALVKLLYHAEALAPFVPATEPDATATMRRVNKAIAAVSQAQTTAVSAKHVKLLSQISGVNAIAAAFVLYSQFYGPNGSFDE